MTKLLASLGLISVALATPAVAQFQETRTRSVEYGDLDLSTANGIAHLDRRIAAAVTAVCGAQENDRVMARPIRLCRQAAFADALPQRNYALGHPGASGTVRIAGAR